MSWKSNYERWVHFRSLDEELKNCLNDSNILMLEDQFYKNLEFGTGGMRGELGPGTNRMNIYTVRKAAEGLARYMEEQGVDAKKRGIVMAYDSRHKSPEFALEVAKTAGKYGIKTYLFDELRPTPELSFAVRYLQAFAGVVITASHNPPEYNGFKLYGEDGGQITPSAAEIIIKHIDSIEDELSIPVMSEENLLEKGLLFYIGKNIDLAYLSQLKMIQLNENIDKNVRIVYTPLHGSGNKLIVNSLREFGYSNVTVVSEQEWPDPNFSTVKSPNPEEHEAFTLAIKYGEQIGADLLMATDPDADRLGVAVKDRKGNYIVLTGNQIGALMLHYLLLQKSQKGTLPIDGVVIKTIVTSEIGRVIAEDFGMNTLNTLTGFKYIGEKIKEFEESSENTYLFGYEESYGYLIGDFVRDKDAVQAAVFVAEVAAYYKKRNISLFDGLMEIYEKYGYYKESLESITLKGKDGLSQINRIMTSFRESKVTEIGESMVAYAEDYQTGIKINMQNGQAEELELPKSNVLKYVCEDDSWFCLRPSGTEPKIKFYFGVKGESFLNSEFLLSRLQKDVMNRVFVASR